MLGESVKLDSLDILEMTQDTEDKQVDASFCFRFFNMSCVKCRNIKFTSNL